MSEQANADPNEVIVVSFPDENKAQEVLNVLKSLDHEGAAQLRNAAIIRRNASGEITITETRDFSDKQGAIAGALAGGLIGLLRGHALAGAAIGAAGGFGAAKVVDLGFPDEYLRNLGQQLKPGSSAIVAVVTFTNVDRAMATLDQFSGGTIMRQTLAPEVAQKLAAAVTD
ncbi:MAG TPA: DUF1269 domain-containing protein [Ktedonobacterales bacterium]